ncbi:hypothetical protein [Paraburkholderia bannensis]|uniref:hypothetical protein n=1 Tax=Paraburkholderia bannensis TaxID=765414 RepID=UPI002ABDA402|nr:hypothetical protein [Paraburkholderia bannensis]
METTNRGLSDYSASYRDRLFNAIGEAKSLGFTRPPLISATANIADESLRRTSELLNYFSGFFDMVIPGYWGNSCQTLSSNIFAQLNNEGIPADIVLGNVIINGTDGFETTLESLQAEVLTTSPLLGEQRVHAWVSLGGDTIVDAALPPRLVKHYNAPEYLNDMIFIGRAAEMYERFNLQYQPILVGTEFFAKTNPPDPMDLLGELMKRRRS